MFLEHGQAAYLCRRRACSTPLPVAVQRAVRDASQSAAVALPAALGQHPLHVPPRTAAHSPRSRTRRRVRGQALRAMDERSYQLRRNRRGGRSQGRRGHEPRKPWPVADEELDVLLRTQVLEHVADGDRLLMEASRVLKPGVPCWSRFRSSMASMRGLTTTLAVLAAGCARGDWRAIQARGDHSPGRHRQHA